MPRSALVSQPACVQHVNGFLMLGKKGAKLCPAEVSVQFVAMPDEIDAFFKAVVTKLLAALTSAFKIL